MKDYIQTLIKKAENDELCSISIYDDGNFHFLNDENEVELVLVDKNEVITCFYVEDYTDSNNYKYVESHKMYTVKDGVVESITDNLV